MINKKNILTKEDVTKIKKLSKDPYIYQKFTDTILPTIKDYNELKKAILLQMFMGVGKQIDDNPYIKEGINILIINNNDYYNQIIYNNLQKFVNDKFKVYTNIYNKKEEDILNILNKKNSVLFISNFKDEYSDNYTIFEQIEISLEIINQFDLIFVYNDTPQMEEDSKIVDHILKLYDRNVEYRIEPLFFKKYLSYAIHSSKPSKLTKGAKV